VGDDSVKISGKVLSQVVLPLVFHSLISAPDADGHTQHRKMKNKPAGPTQKQTGACGPRARVLHSRPLVHWRARSRSADAGRRCRGDRRRARRATELGPVLPHAHPSLQAGAQAWRIYGARQRAERCLLSQAERDPSHERVLMRAICAVIDNFHFDVSLAATERAEIAAAVRKQQRQRSGKRKRSSGPERPASKTEDEEREEAEQARRAAGGAAVEENDAKEDKEGIEPAAEAAAADEDEDAAKADDNTGDADADAEDEAAELEDAAAAGDEEDESKGEKNDASVISRALLSAILPRLQRLLTKVRTKPLSAKAELRRTVGGTKTDTAKEETELRVPVVMALVKLLAKLPVPVFRLHFPQLVQSVCDQLRSKLQTVRTWHTCWL
jgi:hypothetical protein